MKRLQMDRGERDEGGLNKCYSVLLPPSPWREGTRSNGAPAPADGTTAPLPSVPFLILQVGNRGDGKFRPGPVAVPVRLPRSARVGESAPTGKGRRERRRGAGPARTRPPAADIGELGEPTTNTYAFRTVLGPKRTKVEIKEGSRPLI